MKEHKNILDSMLDDEYTNILDLGSGKTSMSLLLNKFQDSNITGVCYPGDNRKLDKIKSECIGKYSLIEKDICKDSIEDRFDLILCHLLFGEATKFGNTLENMSGKVFGLDSKYILVIDYLEDPDIDFDLLIQTAKDKGYYLLKKEIFQKEVHEKYSTFIGKNYIAILFTK